MDPLPPHVTLLGRPNVGKSSLLNAIVGRRLSVVDARPGTTRDRVVAYVAHRDHHFALIDTGGITGERGTALAEGMQRQIEYAVEAADLLCLVTDVRAGCHPADQEIVRRLRTVGKPFVLVANKVDTPAFEPAAKEFARLGLGPPLPVSALCRIGIRGLLDRIVEGLPGGGGREALRAPEMRLAIVGRRNAGKSTLVNRLAGEDRVLVSEIPGTTRDAIDVRFEKDGKVYVAVDTAGLRRRGKMDDAVDHYSQIRTEQAIRHADVVLFLLDAGVEISILEKRLGEFVADEGRPCVLVLNKWDRAEEKGLQPEAYVEYVNERLPGIAFAPLTMISAKTGFNVEEMIDVAYQVYVQSGTRIPTARLNGVLEYAKELQSPPARGGRRPKIYFATQIDVRPPTIVLMVNDPSLFGADYRRFLSNRFRENLPFPEIPIRLHFKRRGPPRKRKGSSG
ncbi:MAG: ribosome biogenesis GTPase Der [Planctomycetes bacterium]|nr:ribosome biogenesis GTPase Der [Planctomycetota bacterium]